MSKARKYLRVVRSRRALQTGLVAFGLAIAVLAWLVWPYAVRFGDVGAERNAQPSRLYGRPMELAVGSTIARSAVIEELAALRYREGEGEPLVPGRYRAAGDRLTIHLAPHVGPQGRVEPSRVEILWNGGSVVRIRTEAGEPERLALPSPPIASYYDERMREVFPVRLEELPEHVIDAVLAAEDDGFYRHLGLSPTGIGRALVVNLQEGEIEQGGSTITQQLVKNVFLTQERTLVRKAREAILAVLVEMQHPKERILQAYLNQIYLGTKDGVNFHGIGAAAWALYGKRPQDLTVGEAATIAGMIRSPGDFSPLHDPQAARERRDTVLERMRELGRIDDPTLEAARAEPVEIDPGPLGRDGAPYFAAAVRQEAAERFGIDRLGGTGHQLFTTLDRREQEAAEAAVREHLDRLDSGGELQGALLSVDPRSGEVFAYVGGRSFDDSEFDRVRKAQRHPGSAFKPVVLAAAIETLGATPVTRLRDSPIRVQTGSKVWVPRNTDRRHRGTVTVRKALEQSLNVPFVRLALDTGLEEVAATAKRMGLEAAPDPNPSLSLGAVDASPWEMATIYSTLAASGLRPRLHTLDGILDAEGRALDDRDPPPSEGERVLAPSTAFLVSSALQGVIRRGTGRRALSYGIPGPLAGKTGTSNEGRDAWFAGYRPDRVTVAWVGYDDPRDSRLSGSRSALPIWARYSAATLPPTEATFDPPESFVATVVCVDSGRLPGAFCPTRVEEHLPPGDVPSTQCDLHERKRLEPLRVRWPEKVEGWFEEKLGEIFGDG